MTSREEAQEQLAGFRSWSGGATARFAAAQAAIIRSLVGQVAELVGDGLAGREGAEPGEPGQAGAAGPPGGALGCPPAPVLRRLPAWTAPPCSPTITS